MLELLPKPGRVGAAIDVQLPVGQRCIRSGSVDRQSCQLAIREVYVIALLGANGLAMQLGLAGQQMGQGTACEL